MKIIRTFLVLLLCAMLPLSGLAASGLTGQCPLQAAMGDDTAAMSQNMPGCDGMKSASAGHGKSGGMFCKMTAQCQAGSLYHPVSLPALSRPAGRPSPVRFHYAVACPARSPDGLWRPPRAL
ncbi:hypothetical protein [Paraburkholderia sp. J12]|uniref:hypothetical protein n=1 Tax=Paraburkholderia sp. J12 TaxID=2805432 RepID=UPI002ABE8437|nr:hypothetical protein [Paraburkholderia sp. J12]